MARLGAATLAAVARSVRLYHGDKARNARMDALYARFLRPDDLAFDIGAHVGDRVSSFRRLGARVVAVEPQLGPARAIAIIHGRDPGVRLVQAAVSDREQTLRLKINTRNPTVSTVSDAFVAAAAGARGWEGQFWDAEIEVPATTLERLIAAYGMPAFIKIDVEGFEDRVLAGLHSRVAALSFEFTTIAIDVALRCFDRIAARGTYEYNLALGENQMLEFSDWITAEAMADHLIGLPHAANSGDVYARVRA